MGIGYGVLVENPNKNLGITNTKLQIVAYDSKNTIVKVDSVTISLALPGEITGIAGTLLGVEGDQVEKIEVQQQPGKLVQMDTTARFTSKNVSFIPGSYGMNKVTGIINNPFTKTFKLARVSAIAYDAAGNIIGGGWTFSELPAGSQTAIETSIDVQNTPAKVEIFAQPSVLDTM